MQRHCKKGGGAKKKGSRRVKEKARSSGEHPRVEDRLKPKPEFHHRHYQHQCNANVFPALKEI